MYLAGLGGLALLDQDVWIWNGFGWTVHVEQGQIFGRRSDAAVAYDERGRQIVLVGGLGSPELEARAPTRDTWLWDGSVWVDYLRLSTTYQPEMPDSSEWM